MPTSSGEGVVEFLHRYGIGTAVTLAAGPLAGKTKSAAERETSRILATKKIESHRLHGASCYYTLSASAAREHGIYEGQPRMGQPLGAQALCQAYAMMASCVLGTPRKVRLTRDEFAAKFPMICRDARTIKHYRTRYFIDESEKEAGVIRLGLFVVDFGQQLRRLVRKVRREVERRRESSFKPLVAEGLLKPWVLTAFEKKAEQIRVELAKESFPTGVEVVPGFADLF